MLLLPLLEPIHAAAPPSWDRSGAIAARVHDVEAIRGLADVGRVEVLLGDGQVVRVHPAEGVDDLELTATLEASAYVAWAHPDWILPTVADDLTDDPWVEEQWHLKNTGQGGYTPGVDVGAEDAWILSRGEGALVAVLDSGVDLVHPDLSVTSGWDYLGDDAESQDESGHGTGAGGLIAAVGDNGVGVAGVAPDADLYAIRIIGGDSTTTDLYEAFVEATDAGAWVINNSWSIGSDCDGYTLPSALREGLDYADTQGRDGLGTVIVFSAGNEGCDLQDEGLKRHSATFVVSATDGFDDRESYSNFGKHVDVTAPSGGLLTTDISGEAGYGSYDGDPDYYGYFSGTSASAPVVSGVATLVLAANPRLTSAQVREVLCDTAARIDIDDAEYDETGWSPYYGCGRVRADAAVWAVANEAPGAPSPTGPDSPRVDHVVLTWAAAPDVDGDWLGYTVTWWTDGDPVVESVEGTRLDLTGRVDAETTVTWTAQAQDLWGPGPASDHAQFDVRPEWTKPKPEPVPSTCGAPLVPTALLVLSGVLALRGRRESPSEAGTKGRSPGPTG